jgi:flagellar biosynthesis protein
MSQRREAIALEYGAHTVPVVTAKGVDGVAERIIEEALRQGVYVSQDPQLLALLSRLNVDEEIPPELYTTIAVILSWVYWLRGMRPGDEKTGVNTGGQPPQQPQRSAQGRPEIDEFDEAEQADPADPTGEGPNGGKPKAADRAEDIEDVAEKKPAPDAADGGAS